MTAKIVQLPLNAKSDEPIIHDMKRTCEQMRAFIYHNQQLFRNYDVDKWQQALHYALQAAVSYAGDVEYNRRPRA